MAEARNAVAEPRVFEIDEGKDTWRDLFRAFRKSIVRRYYRTRNSIRNGVWPASPSNLGTVVTIVFVLLLAKPKNSDSFTQVLWELEDWLYLSQGIPRLLRAALVAFVVGVLFFISLTTVRLYLLRILLSYRGWMYEQLRRPSRRTIFWGIIVRLVSGYQPSLFSCQRSLPRLPVPPLKETVDKLLASLEPLCSKEEHQQLTEMAKKFMNGIGPKIQKILLLKSWWAPNYVSDWWEKYVYLMSRSPIAINSNYYGIDQSHWLPTKLQISRASHIAHWCLVFKRCIDREELAPLLIRGTIPICMAQYERLFSTTRIPGENIDELVHYESSDSRHIIVVCKGVYYKVDVYDAKNQLLSPSSLEQQLKLIVDDAETQHANLTDAERSVAALTSLDRSDWAIIRRQFFFKGVNKETIELIDKAIFCLWLCDTAPNTLTEKGKSLLHGDGCSIWFDKCVTIVVFADGQAGLNCEHSLADAPCYAHMWEYVCTKEVLEKCYLDDGRCMLMPKTFRQSAFKRPVRLVWEVKPTLAVKIQQAVKFSEANNADLDLEVREHKGWAKGVMKQCKLSPDGFVQMALQLAYYRDAGQFAQTYEASMTRLYQNGRTETVRSCTTEAANFVKAMEDSSVERAEKIRLLREASEYHQQMYRDAMNGKGVDRHLFALYVACKGLGYESEFLKKVLTRPWTLSTSQQPQQQQTHVPDCNSPVFLDKLSPGGGFGPVSDDGYGVSYMISSDHNMFFHVSSKHSSPHTNSTRFCDGIFKALSDIRQLFTIEENGNA